MATRPKDTTKDETILAKTGKTREDWYAILDRFDCKSKGHKASATHLLEVHGVDAWYAQGITVEYERDHGIREVGQRSDGYFAVSVSRTIAVPIQQVWEAWASSDHVSRWLNTSSDHDFNEGGAYQHGNGDFGVYKRIVPLKRLTFTCDNEDKCPGSRVGVDFLSKGESKTSIVITHERIGNKPASEEMKQWWISAVESLKSYLETGQPTA